MKIDGWSVVKEDKWEDVTGEVIIENTKEGYSYFGAKNTHRSLDCSKDYKFSLTHMYSLPEDWYEGWMISDSLKNFMEQFKKPCIIVERKVD